jgi:signal transduction histidine kinase/CheY-like chemotaxis protein
LPLSPKILSAVGLGLTGALLGATLLLVVGPAIERDQRGIEDARRLKQLDTSLTLTLLGARHSLFTNYDPIVEATHLLEEETTRVLTPATQTHDRDAAAIDAARARAAEAIRRKVTTMEDFKSSFSVLRNAVAVLSVLAIDLSEFRPASDEEIEISRRATVLLLSVSRLLTDDDVVHAGAVKRARDALLAGTRVPDRLRELASRIVAQSDLAQRHSREVDARITEVLGTPVGKRLDDLVTAYVHRNDHIEGWRRMLELGIGLTALIAVALTIRGLHGQRRERMSLEHRISERSQDLADANRRLTRANRAKTEFLANMSHEIRTPLAAILGFADLLDDERLEDGERHKIARIIRRNGEHLLTILSNILDIAKIEAGKLTVEKIPCSPREIAEEVCALLRNRADAKGIQLSLRIESPAIPRRIESDPTRIRQILVNLVGNAIKFTEQGSVTLVVGLEMRRDGPALRFEVKDTGVGMTPDELRRVFADFEQGDASTTRRFGGTGLGLGLAICSRLTAVLSGEITAQSARQRGSTFKLVLPVSELPQLVEDLERTPVVAPRGVPPRRGLRVLLADDSSDIRLLIARFLTDIDAEVVVVANGRQAVEQALAGRLEARPFDLILMDLHMPELDGAEAVRALRAEGLEIPMIALTASAYEEDRERCTQAGYSDVLTKPIDRAQLIQRIATLTGIAADPAPAGSAPGPAGACPTPKLSPAPPPTSPPTPTPTPTDARVMRPLAIFDTARLLEMLGGDETVKQTVLALFQDDAPPLLRALQDAAANRDAAAVRAGAHKLKGMLLNVCAQQAADVAGELESSARAGEQARFAPLAGMLRTEVSRVCESMTGSAPSL